MTYLQALGWCLAALYVVIVAIGVLVCWPKKETNARPRP